MTCSVCGGPVHPDRWALGYRYCTQPECVTEALKPLEILQVEVNKAGPDIRAVTPEVRDEMRSGRLRDQRRLGYGNLPRRTGEARTAHGEQRPQARGKVLPGTPSKQRQVRAMYAQGKKIPQIARETGLSEWAVTQIMLEARK